MEEDDDQKRGLYDCAFQTECIYHYQQLVKSRDALWKDMGYRAIVRRESCEKVCPKQFTYVLQCISPSLT
jgi:hypothetical protein